MAVNLLKNNAIIIELDESYALNNGAIYDEISSVIKTHKRKNVVLDFSRLDFIDECGVQALARAIKKYTAKGIAFFAYKPAKSIIKQMVEKDISTRISFTGEREGIHKKRR